MARILLVDDEAATRDLVRRALELEGHAVVTAPDGSDALSQLVGGTEVDLLVTDVQMPSLDGIRLAEKVLERTPSLRILLMSGFADQLDRAQSLKTGRASVIAKPFTLEQLRAAVKSALA